MGYTLTPVAIDFGKLSTVIGSKDESLLNLLAEKFCDEFDGIDALGDDDEDAGDDHDEGDDHDRSASLQKLGQFLESAKQELVKGQPPEKALGKLDELDIPQSLKMALQGLLSDAEPSSSQPESDLEESRPQCASTADVLRHLVMGEEQDRRVAFKYGYVLRCLCRHFGEELPHDRWHDLRRGSQWFEELDKELQSAGVPARTLSISKHLVERGSPIPIPKYSGFPSIGYLRGAQIERAVTALSKLRFVGVDEADESEDPQAYLKDVRNWLQTCADSKRDLICFYA